MSRSMEGNVELKIPVNAEYVSVIRLLISGLGARLGLDFEEVQKLKLVVGEAFLTVVDKCEQATGLIMLKWAEAETNITVSLFDPAGQRKSVINAANVALLKTLGGEYTDLVKDGMSRLDIGFQIKHKDNRPYIFHDRGDGQA